MFEEKEPEFVIMPLVQPNVDGEKIDVATIRKYANETLSGYPPEDRALAWLVLSGLYTEIPNDWPEKQKKLVENYWSFVKEFGVEGWEEKDIPDRIQSSDMPVPNKQLMSAIHCDTIRTGRQIIFFPPERMPPKGEKDPLYPFKGYIRRVERILYIFGTLNVALGYIQGFNELVLPLYYIMLKSTALFRNDQKVIEALTFSLLQQIITSTPVHEMYTMQDGSSIIMHKLGEFVSLIERHIPKAYAILTKLKIHPCVYCYRWFNLLFAQEYDLPNMLLIWDTLMGHINEFMKWAFYIGLGQIKVIENRLKPNDMSATILALQDLGINNVVPVIQWATHYCKIDHERK